MAACLICGQLQTLSTNALEQLTKLALVLAGDYMRLKQVLLLLLLPTQDLLMTRSAATTLLFCVGWPVAVLSHGSVVKAFDIWSSVDGERRRSRLYEYPRCKIDPLRRQGWISDLRGGGGSHNQPNVGLQQRNLPTGRVESTSFMHSLWYLPFLVCILSFWSFPWLSGLFHRIVQWASSNTWIPETEDQINLQTNVVTQVVNGPVITSVSVLFASLVGLTISNLHSRQVEIHKSLVSEVHNLRELQSLLHSRTARASIDATRLAEALAHVQLHTSTLFSIRYTTSRDRMDAHAYIESSLPELLHWANEQELEASLKDRRQSNAGPTASISNQVHRLVQALMEERGKRWMALQTVPFPALHYLTLSWLANGIIVSFLVATAQAEYIFLRGLPVRILWSVLITSFAALGVVCFDLSRPFGGAYTIL